MFCVLLSIAVTSFIWTKYLFDKQSFLKLNLGHNNDAKESIITSEAGKKLKIFCSIISVKDDLKNSKVI